MNLNSLKISWYCRNLIIDEPWKSLFSSRYKHIFCSAVIFFYISALLFCLDSVSFQSPTTSPLKKLCPSSFSDSEWNSINHQQIQRSCGSPIITIMRADREKKVAFWPHQNHVVQRPIICQTHFVTQGVSLWICGARHNWTYAQQKRPPC